MGPGGGEEEEEEEEEEGETKLRSQGWDSAYEGRRGEGDRYKDGLMKSFCGQEEERRKR